MKSGPNDGHFRKVLEFECFRFYPAERLLEANGKRVALTPRLTDLLILMLDHRGELVTKEMILQTLWPNSFVEENNINQAVSALRKTLGKSARGVQFIETVPKLGFRFLVPVSMSEEEVDQLSGDGSKKQRTWVWAAAAIGVVALAGTIAIAIVISARKHAASSRDGLTNLTNHLAEDSSPISSPDGTKIVFTSNRDGNTNIYSMNTDGSNVVRLTTVQAEEQSPTWSPDGTKVLFGSNRDGNAELYVMNADGSGQTRLTFNPTVDGGPARFSPDGKMIAFARSAAVDGPDYYNFDIYTMNSDGSDVKQLTTDKEYDTGPVWSPDGRKIAFVSGREGNFDVLTMNTDGSEQIDLTNTPENDGPMAWMPDGRSIVITGEAKNGVNQLSMINSDGTDRRQLTSFAENSYRIFGYPTIPGKLVIASRKEGNSEIYLLDAELPGN
jgi:TolB protein